MADPFEIPDGVEDDYEDEQVSQPASSEGMPEERMPTSGFSRPGAKNAAVLAATNYVSALEKSQKTNAEIMQDAQRVLLQRANEPMDAGAWFRVAAAFGKPTRTGSFGESLSNVNEVLGAEADKKLKAKRDLEEMQMKYKMQLGSQAADLSKAQLDAYVRTAGIKEAPASPVRQLQMEAASLPEGSAERQQIEARIARMTAPKAGAADAGTTAAMKRYAFGVVQQHRKDPNSVSPEELKDARIILGLEKIEGGKYASGFNLKERAYRVLEQYRLDPNSVTEQEVSDARKILGLEDQKKDEKPAPLSSQGKLYTDKHLARAAQEKFGSAAVPENEADRKAVEAQAAQYRIDEKNARLQEKREGRPPPKPPKEKEPVLDLEDVPFIARQLGVPSNTRPYEGVGDKTVQQLLVSNTKGAQKSLAKLEGLTSNTLATDADVKRFLALNKKNSTGPSYAYRPGITLGTPYQTMQSIASKLAPENRKEGTGSVSDFDAKQLIKMTLSIENGYETNKDVGAALLAYNQSLRDKAKFFSDYFQANRHLDGADAAWLSYMNANPIFDPRKPDRPVINTRRKTYKQFFYPVEHKAQGGMVGYGNGGIVDMVNNYQGYGDLASLRQKYAHGGAVKMQQGGDPEDAPVESVVRLRGTPPASDMGNRARAFFGQGMGMSFGDEAEALYRSLGQSNRSYDQILNDIRADYRRWSEENPGQALFGEFTGGVAPSIAAMAVPGGQQLTAANAARMSRLVPSLTKTPVRRAMTAGATSGAISGFGAGEEGLGSRFLESGKGALFGGSLGPIVGKGGELLYEGGKGIYKRLLKPGTNRIEEAALDKVLKKMAQDGMTPQQAIRQVALERGYMPSPQPAGTRPRTQLRDVSPGLTDLAEAVANRPGAGRTEMVKDVLKTGRKTKGNVMQMVEERVGKGKTMFDTETALTDNLRSNADTLYENAYKYGTVTDPRILSMLDQPQFKQAYQQVLETNKIRKANAIAKGEDPSKFDMKEIYKITETQPGIYQMDLVAAPDVKTLDQMKRGLDYIIRSGRRSENAAAQDASHALNEYKNTFLNVLDEVVPDYKIARSQYRGDLEVLDALDFGRNQFGKMAPDRAADYVSKLTPAEKDALRIGYAQQFIDKIGNSKNAINAAEEVLGAENNVGRLQTLFDTPQEFEVFKGILKAESRNVKSGQQIAQGSATGRRKELQKEFEGDNVAATMLDLAAGGPKEFFFRIMRKAPDLFKNEEVAASVTKILNTGKPAELNALLRQLEQRADRFAAEQARLRNIGMAGTKGAARMSGTSPVGANAEEEEINIPSSVEGENTGVVVPDDYRPPAPEPEAPEPEVIIQEAEPEEIEQPQEYRRGGGVNRMQYGDPRKQLLAKYGAPPRPDMPTDYRGGGMVSHKALGGVVRKMHK
jgi:hypothetical protein